MAHIYDLAADGLKEDGERSVVDYLSENELDDEELDQMEKPIYLDENFPNSLVLCNLPKVPEKKIDKLKQFLGSFIKKVFAQSNMEMTVELQMPFDHENECTHGCTFATFEKVEGANKMKEVWKGGYRLDKEHLVKIMSIEEFDDICNRADNFTPKRTLQRIDRSDFRRWLCDSKCREQLLLRYGAETAIFWHDTMAGQPVMYYGGEREKAGGKVWCDWHVRWSPLGSQLATFHQQGIALWAGENDDGEAFRTKQRLPHQNPKEIDFSPNEEFVMVWNGAHYSDNDEKAYSIFHVLTGKCVRQCKTPTHSPTGGDFPHLLWSSDGKYLAECAENRISVRDTQTWGVLKDETGTPKTIKFESLSTFQWSPKGNIIAVWTLEKDNNPARLVLVEIPSRKELASRSRTQCEAVMHWQSEGDYLCLQVTKLSKTKKRISTNMEILRVREKNIPTDVVNVEDLVRGFFWETKGRRFAVLTTDDAGVRPKLQIYMLGLEKCEQLVCFDLPSNSYNQVFWAPEGQYFVVAAMGSGGSSGDLLFAGLNAENKLEILHRDEHYMLTNVQWDPSSRYVTTAVTQAMDGEKGDGYRYSMELGFAIWTFQGRKLFQQQKEQLYHVAWRPHPPSLLPKIKQDQIRKEIKTYSKKYDARDEQAKEHARQSFKRDREAKTNAFKEVLDRLMDWKHDKMERKGWDESLADFQEGLNWTEEQEVIAEQISQHEELIS